MTRRAVAPCVAALCLLLAACAPKRIQLPSGGGEPASDGADALAQATAVCRPIRTFSAEAAVSGKADGQRLRGRLQVGVAAPASARIEAVAPFGAPLFILVAVNDDATLLLPRDDRVLTRGKPDEVLAALAGAPLDAAGLRTALTGCAPDRPAIQSAKQFGPQWRQILVAPDDELILHRDRGDADWQLVAAHHHRDQSPRSWTSEYREFQNGLPRAVRIIRASSATDLQLQLAQVEVNAPLGSEVFRVDVPSSARPISLDELRNARPGVRKD